MRKILSLLLFACPFIGLSFPAQGQDIGNYVLTENKKVGTLTDMSDVKNKNILIGSSKSNTASEVVPIGFDFIFMGKVYNTFSVNTNGVLRLGEEKVLATANTYGIPGNDRIVPLSGWLMQERRYFFGYPYWADISSALGTSPWGRVHYTVLDSGPYVAPNRVLVVEWKNMEIPAGSGRSDITFQLRLHESNVLTVSKSGSIEMIYGSGSMQDGLRNFTFRTGFGIGPEQGNFVAINHATSSTIQEQNFLSGPVSGNISYFQPQNGKNLIYRFEVPDDKKPIGTFSNFELVCPAPNAATFRFTEDCPNEAGIAIYRRAANSPKLSFEFVTSLPPDARSFSDGGVNPGQSFEYRFYLLSESHYAESFSTYISEPMQSGVAFQAIQSGNWTNAATWGGRMPGKINDVEVGCAGSVFVTADGDAQVHNLTIQQGSFLTIADGATLSVTGDFINNGVFNPIGSGKLVLNGAEVQVLENNGKGITNDQGLEAGGWDQRWGANETGTVAEKTIEVSDATFEAIKSVKVSISEAFLRDVSIYLRTPGGQRYALAISRGQGGSTVDAVFSDTGIPLPPTVQSKNLEGEYRPEESFSSYTGPFNGTWTLEVVDAMTGSGGALTGFELTLSRGGSNDLVMQQIAIENTSSEGVILNSGLVVQGSMTLTEGVLHGSDDITVLFDAGASSNEGNAGSYIDATVLKRGTADFTFPIGNAGKWAPLRIEDLQNADNETTFKATFHNEGPAARDQLGDNMVRVSSLEYWDLSPVNGTATLDVVLYYKDAESSEITDISSGDLVVAHYTNNQWVNEGGDILSGSTLEAGRLRAVNISTFSPFTFGSQNGINSLPVELISFSARAEKQATVLNWETASELNNSHFEVERSNDGTYWTKIGVVEGMGTTKERQSYTFTDEQIRIGLSYYRLRQVDYDGAFEYSPVEQLQRRGAGEVFSFYPNPAQTHITINSSVYPAELTVLGQQGMVVWKEDIQSSEEELQLPRLAAGIYILQLRHAAGLDYQRMIITE